MHRLTTAIPAAAAMVIASCGPPPNGSGPLDGGGSVPDGPIDTLATHWELHRTAESSDLVLAPASGPTLIRISCPSAGRQLVVNVPAFQPIGSEERMSFGSGGNVVALVADTKGDAALGGVTGTGEVPQNLDALLSGPISASYGAQASGPHPAPPSDVAAQQLEACKSASGRPVPTPQPASACQMQDGQAIAANRLRAVGTEPFWGARIEGRCVTYSTPEDQAGTRVWARFSGSRDAGVWVGSLKGARFELRTTPAAACSDGMSDRQYPVAVTLSVANEVRKGCAERL